MSVLDYFEAIFCINLDSRPDRWKNVQKEFDKIGIKDKVMRLPGVVYVDLNGKILPAIGCHISHASCIHTAKLLQAKNCLIFEDDVQFLPNFLDVVPQAIKELDAIGWDMFYLGANLERPCYQVTDHLSKLTFAYSTHAYAINGLMFDMIQDINADPRTTHNDVTITETIIPNYNCYICSPMVAIQSPSYSDIEKKDVSYDWMIDRFNKNWVRK